MTLFYNTAMIGIHGRKNERKFRPSHRTVLVDFLCSNRLLCCGALGVGLRIRGVCVSGGGGNCGPDDERVLPLRKAVGLSRAAVRGDPPEPVRWRGGEVPHGELARPLPQQVQR